MPVVRGGYGYGLYNVGDYGTEGSVKDALASIAVSATFAASGGRNLESSAALSATSSFSSSEALRVRESDGAIAGAASITAAGEAIIIERSDKLPWGAGAYGYNRYDLNDLQTIVSVTSALTVAAAERIRPGDASISATSGEASSAEIIKLGSAEVSASASTAANAVYTIKAGAALSASGSISINYIRRRPGSASASGTSGTLSIAREKWEAIGVNAQTYDTIAATSITWSEIAA